MLDKTEISLLDLLRSFSFFISQWWKSGVIGVILGLGLGFVVNMQFDKYYKGSFTIGSNLLSDVTLVEIIEHLNDSKKASLIGDAEFGCSGYNRSNIRQIHASILKNDVNKGMVNVQFEVYNPQSECPIDEAIIHYISSNHYVQSRLKIEQELTNERLAMVDNRLTTLDSLTRVGHSNSSMGSDEYSTLLDYKYETSKIVSLVSAAEILTPAIIPDSPENSKVYYMLAGAMLGFFASFAYSIIRVIRIKLRETGE